MQSATLGTALRQLRAALDPSAAELPDAALLARFVGGDEAAFATLLRRHGPMVHGVSRRVLHNEADADDVFQATFLVLARKAGSIRKRESVGSWLHGVARRLAVRARQQRSRRRQSEQRAADMRQQPSGIREAWQELQEALDDALHGLPESYRSVLVLCYLEGRTQEEAAAQLNTPLGTVRSRLARGRALLRRRLASRGLTLSAAALATALAAPAGAAPVPASLLHPTLKAALAFAGGASAAGLVSGSVATLVESGLLAGAGKKSVAALLACALLVTGTAVGYQLTGSEKDQQPPAAPVVAPAVEKGQPRGAPDALPQGALRRLGSLRLRGPHSAQSVAFGAGGKLLVTAEGEGNVLRLWDTATGRQRGTVRDVIAHTVLACPDGKCVLAAVNNALTILDPETGTVIRKVVPGKTPLHGPLALSADGSRVAAEGSDPMGRVVCVWDVATGRELFCSPVGEKQAGAVGFTADGAQVFAATGTRTEEIRVTFWDVASGREARVLRIPPLHKEQGFRPLACSPDGKTLALEGWATARRQQGNGMVVYSEYRLHLWDLPTGKQRLALDADTEVVWAAAFTGDGGKVACARMDGSLSVWDATSGKRIRKTRAVPDATRPDGAHTLALSSDGGMVASVGSSTLLQLWDVATGRAPGGDAAAHFGPVYHVAFTPDGHAVATASRDGTIRLWNRVTGGERSLIPGDSKGVEALTLTPDGRRAAFATHGDQVHVWDLAAGKTLHTFKERREQQVLYFHFGARAVAFTPDGTELLAFGEDQTLRRWDLATGAERAAHAVALSGLPERARVGPGDPHPGFPRDHVRQAAFLPGARHLVVTTYQDAYVVDVQRGQEAHRLAGVTAFPVALAVSPDGLTLATGKGKEVVLTELVTGKPVRTVSLRDHVGSLAFTRDGRFLAVGTWAKEGLIHLLDVRTGKELGRLRGYGTRAEGLAFSPDGATLASGLQDSTALLWDTSTLRAAVSTLHPVAEAEADRWWSDLASADAALAAAAAWRLGDDPEGTIRLFRARLRPAVAVAPRILEQKIADLDSVEFPRREQAARDLKRLGDEAEPALRAALARKPPLEVRKRIEAILATPAPWLVEEGEKLRRLRAVQVLERLGPMGRPLVEEVARGAPRARETRLARAALDRSR